MRETGFSPVMAKQQKVRFGPGIEGFARRGLNKRPVVSGDRSSSRNDLVCGSPALPDREHQA